MSDTYNPEKHIHVYWVPYCWEQTIKRFNTNDQVTLKGTDALELMLEHPIDYTSDIRKVADTIARQYNYTKVVVLDYKYLLGRERPIK
jgi:hypothetical protein